MSFHLSNITPKDLSRGQDSIHNKFPSIANKSINSMSCKNSMENEKMKQFLIEKYMSKLATRNQNSKSFLVKKAVENVFFKSSLSFKTINKLTKSLKIPEENQKNILLKPKNNNIIENIENVNKNEEISENKELPIAKNEESPPRNKKKLLSDIIPGYRYRKEYYDFDEISLEESDTSQSVKSIYRLKNDNDEWSWLIKNDVENYRSQIQKNQEKLKRQKEILKEELDNQINLKIESKKREKSNDQLYHEKMLSQIKKQDEDEFHENSKHFRNKKQAKIELDHQNENIIKNLLIEKKIDKKMKFLLNQQIEKNIRADNLKMYLTRKKNLERNQEMMRESIENHQNILLDNMKEKEKDVKMMEAYMKDVEKTLVEREIQKKLRMEEIQRKYGNNNENLKTFDRNNKIDIEDEVQLKYFKAKEEEENKQNERHKQKLYQNKKSIKDGLLKQMREKEILKQEEVQANIEQAKYWKKDTMEYFTKEEEKKLTTKQRNIEHTEVLNTQSMTKKIFKLEKKMNDEELLQNKKILKSLVLLKDESPVFRDLIKIKKKIF